MDIVYDKPLSISNPNKKTVTGLRPLRRVRVLCNYTR